MIPMGQSAGLAVKGQQAPWHDPSSYGGASAATTRKLIEDASNPGDMP
jgi:hypothetical protein